MYFSGQVSDEMVSKKNTSKNDININIINNNGKRQVKKKRRVVNVMASFSSLLNNSILKVIRISATKKKTTSSTKEDKTTPLRWKNGKLWSVYQKYMKGGCIPLNHVRDAFNELKLYPSLTQVHEMVCCAQECPQHNSGEGLAFGEFCVFASELEEFYKKGIETPKPVSVIRTARMAVDTKCKTDVFLGGSCDPTTWRADCAIPYLQKQHISYFNPQVTQWNIERIKTEDEAKQTSQVLLFVIDNRTRAISSLIEVAYLVGCQRQVVLVFNESSNDQVIVKGKKVSDSELQEIKQSYNIITHLSERNGYPIFNDLTTSLKCLNRIVKQKIKVQQLSSSDGARPVKYGHLRLGHTLQHLWDVYHSYSEEDSDRLSYKQACEAFHYATGQLLDISEVETLANGSDRIGFSTFCGVVMEAKNQLALCYPSLRQLLTQTLSILLSITKTVPDWLGWMFGRTLRAEKVDGSSDFFLGGKHGDQNWKETIAIPLLREHNCTYITSEQSEECNWLTISRNHAEVERCDLLLYVISADMRALTDMIQAAYYIGQGCQIVLCVQMMPENKDDQQDGAVQDYNRGRAYLCDIAKRENVPVFSDIAEAVRHSILLLKPPPPTLVMTQKVTI